MWHGKLLELFKIKSQKKLNKPLREQLLNLLDYNSIPKHIAIIMDGNGRWAKKRGLPRVAGHRAGVESIRGITQIAEEIGVRVLTFYAFSTENWKRPKEEVNALMKLLQEFIWKEAQQLNEKNIKITAIGRIDKLPHLAHQELLKAIKLTENNTGLIFNLALNYGGRNELVEATTKIAEQVQKGKVSIEKINEELFSSYLYTKNLPDPELLIRTSGELRLSNFLLWQLAYTEFWVTPTYWPDFRDINFLEAILAYQKRDRRFGGVNL